MDKAKQLNGGAVNLIAGGKLFNKAEVKGATLAVAGAQVINQGELLGETVVELWSDQDISNQYGGLIAADTVKLVAKRVLRNGSRTPYVSAVSETNYLIDFYQGDILANQSEAQLGTFYALNKNPAKATGVSMPEDSRANIFARSLEVDAQAVENINPYYRKVSDAEQSGIELEVSRLNQVRIGAEDYLGIKASTYILNSSAQIFQNSADGKLALDAKWFTNERYRVETMLAYEHEETTGTSSGSWYVLGDPLHSSHETTTEALSTKTVAYSPPGLVVAMGRLQANAEQSFINNTAYLEVFGDVVLDTPQITDLGLENQAIGRSSTSTTAIYGISTIGLGNYNANGTTSESSFQLVSPSELDSLFFVHGDFYANADNLAQGGANAVFTNNSPLDYFIEQAIADVLGTYYDNISQQWLDGHLDCSNDYVVWCEHNNWAKRFTTEAVSATATEIDNAKATDRIVVKWEEIQDIDLVHWSAAVEEDADTPWSDGSATESGTDEYSLFTELTGLYNKLANKAGEFFNEISWW